VRDYYVIAFVGLYLASGTSCSTVTCGPGPALPSPHRFGGSSGCAHKITLLVEKIVRRWAIVRLRLGFIRAWCQAWVVGGGQKMRQLLVLTILAPV